MRLVGYVIVVAIAATVAAQQVSKNLVAPDRSVSHSVTSVAPPYPAQGSPRDVVIPRAGEEQSADKPQPRRQLPPPPVAPGCFTDQTVTLTVQDRLGHFVADVEINGRSLSMLVDTGASTVAVPYEAAISMGLDLVNGRKAVSSTANGRVQIILARAPRLRIGSICLYDVEVAVMPTGALNTGLLGMNVIGKMKRFELTDTRLVMAR